LLILKLVSKRHDHREKGLAQGAIDCVSTLGVHTEV
jgi:hypothetical protein